jgi:cytochrome c-type biogenesis protein CcmH/NrfG
MNTTYSRRTLLIPLCLLALIANFGCNREPAGTSDNLKADYERVVKERDELKAEFEKRAAEIEGLWQQKVSDRDEKIADLTSENASLRQRLLVADAAGQDVPLTDAARARSIVWLHVIYIFIIATCLALVATIMWAHVNLRERMRDCLLQQAKFIPVKGVSLE